MGIGGEGTFLYFIPQFKIWNSTAASVDFQFWIVSANIFEIETQIQNSKVDRDSGRILDFASYHFFNTKIPK